MKIISFAGFVLALMLAAGVAQAQQSSAPDQTGGTRGQRDIAFQLASRLTGDCSQCSSDGCERTECQSGGCACSSDSCSSCSSGNSCDCTSGSCGSCGNGQCGSCGRGSCGCGEGCDAECFRRGMREWLGFEPGEAIEEDCRWKRGCISQWLGFRHDYCGPTWSAEADVVYMVRTAPHPSALIVDGGTGATVADAKTFDFNWSTGGDITISRRINGCTTIETRFLGVDGWHANQSFATPALWFIPTNPPLDGFGNADVNATYTSRLYSGEIDLAHRLDNKLVWMWGFRALQLHENLAMNADFGNNVSTLAFNTSNYLYGGQLGADLRLWDHGGCLYIDSILKAGIYDNFANNTFDLSQAAGPSLSTRQSQNQVAFVGEIGLNAVYQMTCHIALEGGYQAMWVEGVAVASDQISSTNIVAGNGINTVGGVLYHGAKVGLNFSW